MWWEASSSLTGFLSYLRKVKDAGNIECHRGNHQYGLGAKGINPMDFLFNLFIDIVIILFFILGVSQFRSPKRARIGNLTVALALASAAIAVVYRGKILEPGIVAIALMVGSVFGWHVAMRVSMIQIPAMIAFQHGAGGIAAFLVSFVELARNTNPGISIGKVSGILGLITGAATFSGSMVASGKLANVIKQTPRFLPKHSYWMAGIIVLIILFGFVASHSMGHKLVYHLMMLIILSTLLGLVFSLRIGGADMPVLISFLNATAGLAAAFCGVIIENRLLVACGATVAASGSILTHVMCRAMNRNLLKVFTGFQEKVAVDWTQTTATGWAEPENKIVTVDKEEQALPEKPTRKDPLSEAIEAGKESKRIIMIAGYGMALAQAQFKVVELANLLERLGKQVKFAIHPVAGRMPGHMNVLLAEAEVPYDKLFEMEEINAEFKETDLAIIVGACDVVNPAAICVEGTPISGMPILMVHEAKRVVVCNLDEKPGYSGVENPLYKERNVILLLGDAKDSLDSLIKGISLDS